MEIGLIHFRVGETDGVSLEMVKWKEVLKNMDFKVYLIAGDMGTSPGFKIPYIAYTDKRSNLLKQRSFIGLDDWDEKKFETEMNKYIGGIYNQLDEMMNLDVLIINNMFSLAHNPAASVALYKFCQDKGIKMIGHHHDFYWERDFYNNPTNNFIKKILDEYFPPKDITHIVINSLAQEELKRKKGVDSYIIPNVFDFNQKQWELDDYNQKIYDKLDISPNDLIFLQATRIVRRKAIELAIDTISEVKKDLNKFTGQETYNGKKITKDTNIFLLLPGLSEESDYVEELKEYATQKDVELKLAFSISDDIRHEEEEIFSLWDFYAIADFITYPSILEGFGNQFLEAIFSKTPVLLFEYPVYKKDIAPLGFEVVTLGSKAEYERGKYRVNQNEIIKAKDKIFDILFNKEKASYVVQKNFELGKKYFSYETLEKKLKQILLEKNVI
ncbi:hypothetical protein PW5551_03030 [Petrotoga sp. 9PW.55.5.1]|uniref:glycosyltransferase family 4 protein n=1 Tax=Petrotoga sp. 9PW.55.5.1 TaxID=1308979 RepID=UPI000DC24022|nr:glycosyltransferase family 4 protein [Petrotoga sp. 9PW.55.5.1]RAO99478.1 hypothetical protein PW5551_03030 [Petrotoga sp. 9PW.55.5.1]